VSSGFKYSSFNGDWTKLGEHNGKAYYQHDGHKDLFVLYGDGQYMITYDVDSTMVYCWCGSDSSGAKDLSECTWDCFDGLNPSALTVTDCGPPGSSGSSPSGSPTTGTPSSNRKSRSRSRSAKVAPHLMDNENEKEKENESHHDIDTNAPSLITVDLQRVWLTLPQALMVAVALIICVALVMRRRAGTCGKAGYAKVQMVEDSEDVSHTEAEQILHFAD